MIDEDEVRNRLVLKQTELQRRIAGTEEECEEPIPEARLRALPYATLCIHCAEEAEQIA